MVKKNIYPGYRFVYDTLKLRGFDIPLYGYSQYYLNHNNQKGVDKDGYLIIGVNGRKILEHKHRAEKALGRPIPQSSIVHHHNANQIIICEDQKYHTLIHKRMRKNGYDKRFWNNRIRELRDYFNIRRE